MSYADLGPMNAIIEGKYLRKSIEDRVLKREREVKAVLDEPY